MKTIGVIGLGSIGMRHARNLITLGHKVRGYDSDMTKRLALNGVLWEIQELYQTDGIVIASPTQLHKAHIGQTMGNHILVEKPIADNYPNALREWIQERDSRNLVTMVGNNLRFHACVKYAKEWLDDKLIGDIHWANFTCAQYSDKPDYLRDSVELNWGAHEIDLALYLLGPATVASANIQYGVADIILYHKSSRSVVHLDYLTRPEWRGFMIAGSNGRISANLVTGHCSLFTADSAGDVLVSTENSFDQNYIDEIVAFLDRIDGKETIGATGEEGIRVLELILKAKEMAE